MLIRKEFDNGEKGTYKLKFIDSFRFTPTSLSSLLDNLFEIYSKKLKDENCKSECDFTEFKNNKLHYKKRMVETSKLIN